MLVGDNTLAAAAAAVLSLGIGIVSFVLGESSPGLASLECGDSTGELVIFSSNDGPVAGNLNVCGNWPEVPLFANGAPLIAGVFGAVAALRSAGLSGATPSMLGKFEVRSGEG